MLRVQGSGFRVYFGFLGIGSMGSNLLDLGYQGLSFLGLGFPGLVFGFRVGVLFVWLLWGMFLESCGSGLGSFRFRD